MQNITFERSRLRFIAVFFLFIFVGIIGFGMTKELTQVLFVFFLLIAFMIAFYYEFYLATSPVIEITNESLMIKEIYHPIFKWRFIYKKHFFSFSSILHLKVKLNKRKEPKLIIIKYQDGNGIREVGVSNADITDFGSFVKYVSDKTGGEKTSVFVN